MFIPAIHWLIILAQLINTRGLGGETADDDDEEFRRMSDIYKDIIFLYYTERRTRLVSLLQEERGAGGRGQEPQGSMHVGTEREVSN
jgi:hypothetical protein